MRASMTTEAAMVLPLFIFCVINLLFGIQVVETSSRVTAALHETGNEICSYGYAIDEGIGESFGTGIASIVYAQNSISKHLGEVTNKRGGIAGGVNGISYVGSSVMSGNGIVNIKASYSLKFPVNMGIKTYRLGTSYYGHAWNGYDVNINMYSNTDEDPIVYITPSGSVYHTNIHCSHLNPSIRSAQMEEVDSLRNKDGAKYYSCELCGTDLDCGTVFLTDYGTRYHSDVSCSGIKRNVMSVHLSEVGGRRACVTCGG